MDMGFQESVASLWLGLSLFLHISGNETVLHQEAVKQCNGLGMRRRQLNHILNTALISDVHSV